MAENNNKEAWHTTLTKLSCITVVDTALYISSRMSVKDPSNRGYKFFTEGYVFDIKGNNISIN